MKKLMIAMAAMAATAQLLAMPIREELSKAQPLVYELMAPAMEEYKSAADKTAAAINVGDRSCAFAAEAETEAAKFLLLKGAVGYYVRGEAYDKAADCIATMQADIDNLTPEVVVEIIGKATSRISESKAPRLLAYYRAAKLQIRARKELYGLEKKLKRANSEQLQRQYAEALAISGNWKAAYDAFAKLRDKDLARIAEAEAKGAAANEQAAELWWNYKPEFEGAENFFKVHAVEFYQKALERGEISGLKKTIVERRIAQINEVPAASAVANAPDVYRGSDATAGRPKTKTIHLGGGVKMEMIYVGPGSFTMGGDNGNKNQRPAHKVTLTEGFWLGKYEVTQKQWKQVMSNNPSKSFKGDDLPVNNVSLEACQEFIKKMNGKLGGGKVRLPTEAEWEYACRAGSEGDFAGTGRLDDMGWYTDNSDGKIHPVGQKSANAWGFHDMHGNVWEWCGDWWGDYPQFDVSDPIGPSSGTERLFRGGSWGSPMRWCLSTYRWKTKPSFADEHSGFRLCMSAEGSSADSKKVSVEQRPAKVVASVRAVNGKEISVKLATGVIMDFVPCPAGTFEMGMAEDAQSAKFKHTVTITRPFWIGKYQVTHGQWRIFKASDLDEREKALGGMEKAKDGVRYADAMAYCNFLMKKYKRYLPTGYVYRLPTEAEWEYALRASCFDENDPYVQVFRRKNDDGLWKKVAVEDEDIKQMAQNNGFPVARLPQYNVLPTMKVGTKLPNSWGVYDMLGNGVELLLDMVQIDNFKKRWSRNEHTDLYGLLRYKAEEVDPLRMVSGKASCPCCFVRRKSKASHGDPLFDKMVNNVYGGVEIYNTFRVVIGPDLLKERGTKLPGHGK